MYNIIKIKASIKDIFTRFKEETSGMGTIEMILLVAVLIALALLFSTFIKNFFGTLSSDMENKVKIDSILNLLH